MGTKAKRHTPSADGNGRRETTKREQKENKTGVRK
jgi:hypothetical protein